MPITDRQMVSFLYSIIKQLEVRHVDWDLVARCNDIARGHTARMRFHRLRLAQDNITPTPRKGDKADSKGDKLCGKGSKTSKEKQSAKRKFIDDDLTDDDEYSSDTPLYAIHKRNIKIKYEEVETEGDGRGAEGNGAATIEVVKIKEEIKEEEPFGIKHEEDGGIKNDEAENSIQMKAETDLLENTESLTAIENCEAPTNTQQLFFGSNLVSMSIDHSPKVSEIAPFLSFQPIGSDLTSGQDLLERSHIDYDLGVGI